MSNQLAQLSDALKGNATLTIGPYEVPHNIQERVSALTEQGTKIDEWSAAVAFGIVTSLIDLVLVLVITFYLLLDIRRLRSIVLRTLDPSHRPAPYVFSAKSPESSGRTSARSCLSRCPWASSSRRCSSRLASRTRCSWRSSPRWPS